jgi:hypothetical protein
MATFKVNDVPVGHHRFINKSISWLTENIGPCVGEMESKGIEDEFYLDKLPGKGWNMYYRFDFENTMMHLEFEIDDEVLAVALALIIRDWL